MDKIEVFVPATSANLGPGFDTLGIAIDLNNRVVIKKNDFFSLSVKGEGSNQKRFKTNNLFIHIFYDVYERLCGQRDNFRFEFYNKIPISRGLGSSSAIITSAVYCAYLFCQKEFDKQVIADRSLIYESHPDNITPAIYGGFCVSYIKDGSVFTLKKEMPSYLKAVVVIPDRAMSTAKSRSSLPKEYKIEDIVYNISRSSYLSAAFFSEDWKALREASEDRLHQDRRMSNMKELFSVKKCALQNGALLSTLSGSGSTFFSIVYEDDEKRVLKALRLRFPHFRVESFDFNNIGLKVKF